MDKHHGDVKGRSDHLCWPNHERLLGYGANETDAQEGAGLAVVVGKVMHEQNGIVH